METGPVNNSTIIKLAWIRTKERWVNYTLIVVQFILLPILIAIIISAAAFVALPIILTFSKDTNTNNAIQFISAALAIILPVAALVSAVYRNIVGSIALTKIVIDPVRDRKKTVEESKRLVTPYINFLTILTLLNIGYLIYIPITLFTVVFFMQVWTQFAMFSFVLDEKKGSFNIWTGIQIYRKNFFMVTGHAILLQLAGTLIANGGNIITYTLDNKKSINIILIVAAVQLAIVACTIIFQIFGIAYMFELYKRLRVPEKILVPTVWVLFSILGWLLALGLVAYGIQYLVAHPPQLPLPIPGIKLDSTR